MEMIALNGVSAGEEQNRFRGRLGDGITMQLWCILTSLV